MDLLYRKHRLYKYTTTSRWITDTRLRPVMEARTSRGFVVLKEDGGLFISKEYSWDGCSGPTWDTLSTMKAGLGHDALYQLMREGKLNITHRQEADEWFKDMMVESGAWKIRSWYFYFAVRNFGKKSAQANENTGKLFSV